MAASVQLRCWLLWIMSGSRLQDDGPQQHNCMVAPCICIHAGVVGDLGWGWRGGHVCMFALLYLCLVAVLLCWRGVGSGGQVSLAEPISNPIQPTTIVIQTPVSTYLGIMEWC